MNSNVDEWMLYDDKFWWSYIGDPRIEEDTRKYLNVANSDIHGFYQSRLEVWTKLRDKWDPWMVGERSYYQEKIDFYRRRIDCHDFFATSKEDSSDNDTILSSLSTMSSESESEEDEDESSTEISDKVTTQASIGENKSVSSDSDSMISDDDKDDSTYYESE